MTEAWEGFVWFATTFGTLCVAMASLFATVTALWISNRGIRHSEKMERLRRRPYLVVRTMKASDMKGEDGPYISFPFTVENIGGSTAEVHKICFARGPLSGTRAFDDDPLYVISPENPPRVLPGERANFKATLPPESRNVAVRISYRLVDERVEGLEADGDSYAERVTEVNIRSRSSTKESVEESNRRRKDRTLDAISRDIERYDR